MKTLQKSIEAEGGSWSGLWRTGRNLRPQTHLADENESSERTVHSDHPRSSPGCRIWEDAREAAPHILVEGVLAIRHPETSLEVFRARLKSFSPAQVAPVELADPVGRVEYFEVDLSPLAPLDGVLYQIPHGLCETRSYPDLNSAQAREASLHRTERAQSRGSLPTQSDLAPRERTYSCFFFIMV
jgi:hypothetical protein